jgi:hypothetical protein
MYTYGSKCKNDKIKGEKKEGRQAAENRLSNGNSLPLWPKGLITKK